MTTIGFDVSKNELVGVRVDRRGRSMENYILPNTPDAIIAFLDGLAPSRTLVAAEATAEHHRWLARACFDRKIAFRLLNPITTKQFTRATVRKKKTDLSDALVVAQLALRGEGTPVTEHSFALLQPVSRTAVKLMQMVHMLTLMDQRIERFFPEESTFREAVAAPRRSSAAPRARHLTTTEIYSKPDP
jgi:transposase